MYLSNLDCNAQGTTLCLLRIECFSEEYDIHSGSCIFTALWVEVMLKKSQETRGREKGSAVRNRTGGDETEVETNTVHSGSPSLCIPIECSAKSLLWPVLIF